MGSKAGMAKRQGDVELGTPKNFFIDNLGMRPQEVSPALHYTAGPEGLRCYYFAKTSKPLAI
jgi:hypothetical protein